MKTLRARLARGHGAAGGIVGPAAFIGAWTVGSLVTSAPYSIVDDPISRLAAVGAPTRVLMTSGFVVFGIGLVDFARAVHRVVPGSSWVAAAGTGGATLLVATAPLDASDAVDRLHGVFAGLGYLTLAAMPLIAARPLAAAGHGMLARIGLAAGIASSIALVLSLTSLPTGLFQRLGLTATDLWIIALAVAILRGRLQPAPERALINR